MTEAAFERGFVAGWEAALRKLEADSDRKASQQSAQAVYNLEHIMQQGTEAGQSDPQSINTELQRVAMQQAPDAGQRVRWSALDDAHSWGKQGRQSSVCSSCGFTPSADCLRSGCIWVLSA